MKASLDTDITIHLYLSGKQDLMFSVFEKLFMHTYLYENELRRKAPSVYEMLKTDIDEGRVEIVRYRDLIEMDIENLFAEYKNDYKYLFDDGELYAVVLAKAMGIDAFVSDDTKDYGPHYSLVREIIEDVIPFAFYELLFLRYLSSDMTLEEVCQVFNEVNSRSLQHPMNFRERMLRTARRFSQRHGTKRDYDWICGFCSQKQTNYKDMMRGLREYLSNLQQG